MLKSVISTKFADAFRSTYNSSNNPVCVQCIRWRKGRWHPIAPSKVFRVPARIKEDPDERAELMRLSNNYRTQIRSVRHYLINDYLVNRDRSTADNVVITPEEEEADFQRCIQENDCWNQEIAILRNQRLENEMATRREYILERLELKEKREKKIEEKAAELVRLEKEKAKTFITREKLDEAIEYCLDNPCDYNFAIDLKCNIHNDRNPSSATASGSLIV